MKNTSIPFQIISKKSEHILYTENVPVFFKDYEIPGAINTIAHGSSGHFSFQEQQHKESLISIRYTNCQPTKDEGLIFLSDNPDLRLQFALKNNFYFKDEGIGKTELHEGNFNMFYAPFLKSEQIMKAGRLYSTFSIHFSRSYLDNWVHHYPVLNAFLSTVDKGQSAVLCSTSQITNVQMDMIIKQLIQNSFTGIAKSIYVDLKIKELFMSALEKISNHPTTDQVCLSKTEVEQFYEAKDVLLKNMQNPMSLKQMSRKFGINTKKIKIGFKQLYERTPFDLLLTTRMEKAKTMLTSSDKSIIEIADEIGYENKHSFSKAFKKYFGYPPGRYRKIKNESYCQYSNSDN